MPTIELISINRQKLFKINNSILPFYVRQNTKLKSHRGLFQDYLNNLNGIILHLGNKEFGRSGFFFGSELIDWDFEENYTGNIDDKDKKLVNGELEIFRFEKEMFFEIEKLLKKVIKGSPNKKCIFYTDYQLGTEHSNNYGKIKLEDFIDLQFNKYYIWNSLYEIYLQ